MKKSKWRKNLKKKTKKLFSQFKKFKKNIPTIWGIIIILAIVNLGLIAWVGILTKELNNSTEGLSEIAMKNLDRQTTWQTDLQNQEKRLLAIEEGRQEKNGSLSWQIYQDENYGFSIQYPDNWTSINSIFDPETIVEFSPQIRVGGEGVISFSLTPYANFDEAAEESLIINAGGKLLDKEEILINGSRGLQVIYQSSEKEKYTHYFFNLDDKTIEISLNSEDLGYNKVFKEMILTLTIEQ